MEEDFISTKINMDNIKTLIDKKQYDLVIKLTENSNDVTETFYCISALVATNQVHKALDMILLKEKLLRTNLKLLIKIHIDILCLLGRFDEAYDVFEEYKNLPYESQEVEEILKAMPTYIRKEERAQSSEKEASIEQIRKYLSNVNEDDAIIGLDLVRAYEPSLFIKEIENIMSSSSRQATRCLALLLLMNKGYNKKVRYFMLDTSEIFEVVPSKLYSPYETELFRGVVSNIQKWRNPPLEDGAYQLLNQYVLMTFPRKIKESVEVVTEALFETVSKLMQNESPLDLKSRCEKLQIDYKKVLEFLKNLQEILENF